MRELCQTHKLAIAPDGKCVLCRRPSLRLFAVREEHETIISRVFTALLGVFLLAAASALIYVSMLDAGYTGGRYVAGPAPIAKLPPSRAAVERAAAKAALAKQQADEQQRAEDAQDAPGRAGAKARAREKAAAAHPRPASVAAQAKPAAAPLAPVAVTMYATPWCDICDRAREFLLARDVVLTEYDIDSDRSAERRLAKLNPNVSVPTFEVSGRAYLGFNPWDLEDAIHAAARAEPAATARAEPAGPARAEPAATARATAARPR